MQSHCRQGCKPRGCCSCGPQARVMRRHTQTKKKPTQLPQQARPESSSPSRGLWCAAGGKRRADGHCRPLKRPAGRIDAKSQTSALFPMAIWRSGAPGGNTGKDRCMPETRVADGPNRAQNMPNSSDCQEHAPQMTERLLTSFGWGTRRRAMFTI